MEAEKDQKKPQAMMHVCGPQCIDGTTDHIWDGPIITLDRGATSSCSRCGKTSIEVCMWM